VTSDIASYSDIVFELFRLLRYQLSPRITELADQRLWRIDPTAHYGPLDPVSRNRINTGRITTHWEDMLRIAGSLATGTARAYDLLRMLGRDGHPTPLGNAIADYGRIAKTLHLLAVIDPDDETYRRTINTQLTVQESQQGHRRRCRTSRSGPDRPVHPQHPQFMGHQLTRQLVHHDRRSRPQHHPAFASDATIGSAD
jgi:TnpA family transposase